MKTALNPTPENRLLDLEEFASRLVDSGAVLSTGHAESDKHLLGSFFMLGTNRLFWFAANGDDPKADGHLLDFDSVQIEHDAQLTFVREGRVIARMTSIEDAAVCDVEDFRAAWHVWRQRRPACDRLIGASLTYHVIHDSRE